MTIAVVIPCFNVEHHVDVAVRSVMDQTYRDVDAVAIDDGSTDGTVAKLVELEKAYPGRFRWKAGPRRGACAARNQGLAMTTGEYVQFLDADDTILTDKLHRQMDLANGLGRPDLIVGDFRNVYEDGHEDTIVGAGERPWLALIRTQLGTTSANLFKRSALEAVGGWNEAQVSSQDYELMFRMLANKATVGWDPHVSSLVLKRMHGSISRTGQRDNWKRFIQLRKDIRDHLRALDPVAFAQEIHAADQHLFMAIRVLAKHDRNSALEAYHTTVERTFVPDRSSATNALYSWCYRVFGFRAAEGMARMLGWFKERVRS